MAELPTTVGGGGFGLKESKLLKGVFAVVGYYVHPSHLLLRLVTIMVKDKGVLVVVVTGME
ncbi:hypothetical protein Ancab_023324, partial [Ancistrocladus abbreviatus]